VKAPQSPDEPQLPSPALALLGHRFAELVRQDPDIPKSQRDFVTSWFRDLLVKAGGREGPSPQLRPGETKPQALPEPGRPAAEARAQTSNVLAESRGIPGASVGAQAPLEEPAFWGKWVKGTLEALTDPKVSPKEAAFHAIQAKEGTAFFELPAPWLPQGVVQLWVESDAPGDTGTGEEVKRLFMGLHLSNLGETRLGLESAGKHLRVRVWTEHPERLAAQEASLVKELEETGQTVTLSILPLGTATPSVRAMAVGASWQGLG